MTRSARTTLWAAAASAAAVLTLHPLVVSSGWIVGALGTVCAVAGAGLVVRGLFHRPGLAVAVQALVVLVVVVVLFGGGTALLGVVPTPATVDRIAQLATDGVQVIQRYSVPAVDLRGLRLLLVAGAGLVALAVDLFAVTLRSPALAGLPLLGVMAIPLALAPGGSGAVVFVLAGVPYLVLLAGERRSAGRGRGTRGGRSVAGVTASATAAVALVAAVAVPAAVPGLDERPLTIDTGSGDTIAVINPILNLKASLGARSDATIVTYTTDEPDPAPLRIVTADVFDGQTWAPSTGADIPRRQRVQDGLPPAPGLSQAVRDASVVRTTSISIRGLDQTYLPLPYPALRVDIPGNWLYETDSLNVVGDGETTRGRQYRVEHLDVQPTEQQLREAPQAPGDLRDRYTELPPMPAVVADTALQVTAGASDDYERAALLQRYFRSSGGFTYSTTAPNDGGTDAVATFLSEKSGFCVQFASAMAVMARSLGIPARVAIGFLPGRERQAGRAGDLSQWRISAQDAHAWPELFFEGVGWVRFEPTPATRTGQSPGYSVPQVAPAPPVQGQTGATPPPAATAAPSASASASTPSATDPAAAAAPTGWDRVLALPWGWVLGALLLVVALLTPWASTLLLTRRRWSRVTHEPSSAEAAWAELDDRVRDLGISWPSSATPRQRAGSLSEFTGSGSAAADRLTRMRAAVESARFGAGTPPAGAGSAGAGSAGAGSAGAVLVGRRTGRQAGRLVRADVDVVVEAVAAARPRWVRWRARLFPTAGVRRVLDWWDRD
ncbi:transglutaminaseTgpA domain-containing protein [Kineococcus sp. LSe6-4]|uniref:TransglutaminaseTgpA domain-containing protein n=1 Tax=Kineococcus halophytocola TaxID=3234027 RepID=A0ABV4GXN3_9ACTN